MDEFRKLQRERWLGEVATREAEEERRKAQAKRESLRKDEEYARQVAAELEEEERRAQAEAASRDFELARQLQGEEIETVREDPPDSQIGASAEDATTAAVRPPSHPNRVERLVQPAPASHIDSDFELARRLQQAELSRVRSHQQGPPPHLPHSPAFGGISADPPAGSDMMMSMFPFGGFGGGRSPGGRMGRMGMGSMFGGPSLFDRLARGGGGAGGATVRQFETPHGGQGREVRFNDGNRSFQFRTVSSGGGGGGFGNMSGNGSRRGFFSSSSGRRPGPRAPPPPPPRASSFSNFRTGGGSGGAYTYEFPDVE